MFITTAINPGLAFFDVAGDNILDELTRAGWQEDTDYRRELCCYSCGSGITSPAEQIDVNGFHAHSYTNPQGVSWHIGCFRQAPGCFQDGDRTLEWTWFSGYTWCYALCANCQSHLGWVYERGTESFYGLILKRLIAKGKE